MKTVLHIPICFLSRNELSLLEQNLIEQSKENVDIYVSINGPAHGHITSIRNLCKRYGAEVFKRENIGYQWGGYYDTFKMIDADWYATLEVDCKLCEGWVEKCISSERDFIGMPTKTRLNKWRLINFFMPKRAGEKAPLNKSHPWFPRRNEIVEHTRGGFFMCSKKLLTEIDDTFGCFTESVSNDHWKDGCILGEIGFCVKVSDLGYELFVLDDICMVR